MGTGMALQAVGNRPKTFRHRKKTKKADGKDAHRQAGGSQAPVFLHRDLSAAFCWQTGPRPSCLPALLQNSSKDCPRRLLSCLSTEPHTSEQQVPVCSQQSTMVYPSPPARGEQGGKSWSLQNSSLPPAKQMDPLQNPACHGHPELLLKGHIPPHCGFNPSLGCQGEREKHRPGALQDGISAQHSPLWAQARVHGGSAVVTLAERRVLPPRVQLVLTRSAARGELTLG